MSTGTLTHDRIGVWPERHLEQPRVHIKVRAQEGDERADAWRQFNEGLIQSVELLELAPQEAIVEGAEPTPTDGRRLVPVAPGIVVGAQEYEERYGGIDIEGLRARMAPAVFKAFVRHIGSVSGREDLDVDLISDIPE